MSKPFYRNQLTNRVIRKPVSTVPDKEAAEVLGHMTGIIYLEAQKFSKLIILIPGVGFEDLVSIASIATIEAWARFDATKANRTAWKLWVSYCGRVIRARLAEYTSQLRLRPTELLDDLDSRESLVKPKTDGYLGQTLAAEPRGDVGYLHMQMSKLNRLSQSVILLKLAGASNIEVGKAMGLPTKRVVGVLDRVRTRLTLNY